MSWTAIWELCQWPSPVPASSFSPDADLFIPGVQVTGWKRKVLLGTAPEDNTARSTKQPFEQTYLYFNKWNIIIQVPHRSHPLLVFFLCFGVQDRRSRKWRIFSFFQARCWSLVKILTSKKPRTARKNISSQVHVQGRQRVASQIRSICNKHSPFYLFSGCWLITPLSFLVCDGAILNWAVALSLQNPGLQPCPHKAIYSTPEFQV